MRDEIDQRMVFSAAGGQGASPSEALAATISEAVRGLAKAGMSRLDIEARIHAIRPEETLQGIQEAVELLRKKDNIRFKKAARSDVVSETAAKASLLFAAGVKLGRSDRTSTGEIELDQEMVLEVSRLLGGEGVSPEGIRDVLDRIQAAREAIASSPGKSLSKTAYDTVRSAFLLEHEVESDNGKAVWPIGSLTVLRKLGGSWNSALESVGMATSAVPEGFGAAQYSSDDYASAMGDFLAGQGSIGEGDSYADYTAWVSMESERGRERPSGPAVRVAYGGWDAARRTRGDTAGLDRVAERRHRSTLHAEGAAREIVRAKEVELARIEDELHEKTADGSLSPDNKEDLEHQRQLALATIASYEQEQKRWDDQKKRWGENDSQAKRQFRINLGLAIAAVIGAVVMPMVVWALETFGPSGP